MTQGRPSLSSRQSTTEFINEYAEVISSNSVATDGAASEQARETLAKAVDRLRGQEGTYRALVPPATERVVDLAD